MIYSSNIPQIWREVEPLLAPAISLSGTHEPEDIYKGLIGGKAQLWVQWSGKVDAAVVTEYVDYPQGLWFRFWLAGALKGASPEWERFFEILYGFAKNSNCVGIEDCGRNGWEKYIPEQYEASKVMTLRRIRIK